MPQSLNSVLGGSKPISDPSCAQTLPDLVRSAAAAYGDDPAITLVGDDVPAETLSFAELDRRSAQIAKGLVARGAGKGTRIGFLFGNGPAFATMFAAIGRIGAIAIPLSTLLKSNELVRVLRHSDVSGLIVQRAFLGLDYIERLCDALPWLRSDQSSDLRIESTPNLRWIVSTGEALPQSIDDLSALLEAAVTVSDDLLSAIEADVHPTDQLIEIYTSGSMALPKGVRHSHGPVLMRAHYLREMIGISRTKAVQAIQPMFWVGGLMMSLMPAWEAGALTICTERTLQSSRFAMGSVLAEEDLAVMAQQRPFWGLGMSETLGPYSYGDELRASGYPLCSPMDHFADGYEVRVANQAGRALQEGEIGEIQVRGSALTSGLHKLDRKDYFTADGFYHTGDLGLFHGNRLQFVGRDGDMIKTAGSNVSPAEVELEIHQLEGVEAAYVIGIPDKERGQLVATAIIARDGVRLDFDKIKRNLRERLSGYKVPRAYTLITREQLPLLPSNKIARKQLAELIIKELGR